MLSFLNNHSYVTCEFTSSSVVLSSGTDVLEIPLSSFSGFESIDCPSLSLTVKGSYSLHNKNFSTLFCCCTFSSLYLEDFRFMFRQDDFCVFYRCFVDNFVFCPQNNITYFDMFSKFDKVKVVYKEHKTHDTNINKFAYLKTNYLDLSSLFLFNFENLSSMFSFCNINKVVFPTNYTKKFHSYSFYRMFYYANIKELVNFHLFPLDDSHIHCKDMFFRANFESPVFLSFSNINDKNDSIFESSFKSIKQAHFVFPYLENIDTQSFCLSECTKFSFPELKKLSVSSHIAIAPSCSLKFPKLQQASTNFIKQLKNTKENFQCSVSSSFYNKYLVN